MQGGWKVNGEAVRYRRNEDGCIGNVKRGVKDCLRGKGVRRICE